MEEIPDHPWDSGKYNRTTDGAWENCVRSQGACFEGHWGIIVLWTSFLCLVSSSINVSIFHITLLDTFWTDLVFPWVWEEVSFLSNDPIFFLGFCGLVLVSSPFQSLSWIFWGVQGWGVVCALFYPVFSPEFPRLDSCTLKSPFWLLLHMPQCSPWSLGFYCKHSQ